MSLTARQLTLVEAVKAHAIANYNTDGWDYVVECYKDDELAELIGKARTEAGAIKKVAEEVKLKDEYRAEIQSAGDTYDYSQDVAVLPQQRDPEPVARPTIEIDAAPSVEEIHNRSPYSLPEATTTGVVCGSCSKEERDYLGDRKAQVRHASAAHVRLCYDRKAEQEAESRAEYAAEKAAERWFEEGDGRDHEEQLASCYPSF